MDFLAQQFIAAAKKLREQLDVLRKYMFRLHRDAQEQVKAIRETRDAYNQSQNTPQVLRAELQVPKAIEVTTSPKDKKSGREWFKLAVETLTLFAVIAYTVIAKHQWSEMISARHQAQGAVEAATRSATAAENTNTAVADQFRLDERPYLWGDPNGIVIDPNKPNALDVIFVAGPNDISAGATVKIRNLGKSPAVGIKMTGTYYKIGPSKWATEQARTYKPKYAINPSDSILMNEGASGPGLVPSSDIIKLTAKELEAIRDGTYDFYIVGGMQYKDIFSPEQTKPYETTYCFHFRPVGLPFANCNFGPGYFGNTMK